ncbi:MAG: SRPBCC family protein [Acidimicrobiia bacterium]|nr:SRPBCC family protein [Acidimicrobiia bacterium]
MHEVTETIEIKRLPEGVHAFLTDPDNALLWQSNLIDFELIDSRYEKGSMLRGMNKVAGKKVEFVAEIAEHELGKHTLIRSTEAPVGFTLEYTFAPAALGTKMTYHMETEAFGGFFGKLADPLVVRMFSKDVRANLEKLKELLEA